MGRSGPVLLLVIAASAVVAIAATGTGLLLPPANLDEGWVGGIRIAAAVAVAIGLAGLPMQRKRLPSRGHRDPEPTLTAGVVAATLMVLVTVIALFGPPLTGTGDPDSESAIATEGTRINPEAIGLPPPPVPAGGGAMPRGFGPEDNRGDRQTPRGPTSSAESEDGFDWGLVGRFGNVLLLVLLIVVGTTGLRALRRRGGRGLRETPEVPVTAVAAEAGLQASLGEVASAGRHPRQQITAAYHRLLAALSAAGAPRLPQEAPHEHLHRTLAPLGVHPGPMHRLTELYVVAQFSEHPITDQHRAAAAEALEGSLVSLRAARGWPSVAVTEPGLEASLA